PGCGARGPAGPDASLGANRGCLALSQRAGTPTAHHHIQREDHMPVLDRSELEASPLADLHAIADQLGLDGFRRLRKAELIDAILGEPGGSASRPESRD